MKIKEVKAEAQRLIAEAESRLESALTLVSDHLDDGALSEKQTDRLQTWADNIEAARDGLDIDFE